MRNIKLLLPILLIISIFILANKVDVTSSVEPKSQHGISDEENNEVSYCLSDVQISSINSNLSPINQGILAAGKERLNHDVTYVDKYYSSNQGKPPDNEGVCTDLFWRSMEGADIDFQEVLYADMKANTRKYPLHIWDQGSPNKSIDFRRVPNIEAYLKLHAQSLSVTIKGCDIENLLEWKAGDIVIFSLDGTGPSDHIAIVSDTRDENGIPNLIHNYGRGEIEDPGARWLEKAVGHYRWR